MSIEKTKEELFKFLGIDPSEIIQISDISVHIPNDQDNNKFVFNYELKDKVEFNE